MKCCFRIPIYLCLLLVTGSLRAQQTPPDSIPTDPKSTEWDVAVEAVQLLEQANTLRDSFSLRLEQAETRQTTLERSVAKAETDTSRAEELKGLRAELKVVEKTYREAEKQLKRARSTAETAALVANMDNRQQRLQVPKIRKQLEQLRNLLQPVTENAQPIAKKEKKKAEKPEKPVEESSVALSESTPPPADSTPPAEPEKRPKVKTPPPAPAKTFKSYSAAEDVMITPPEPPCGPVSSIRDEFSGEVRRESQRSEIFRHTNAALRKIYTDRAHTAGEVSLVSMGLNTALHLHLRVNDPNVRRTQGSLQKGATATLRFVDGYNMILPNLQASEGLLSPDGQFVSFLAQFSIDRSMLKKMRQTELDKIRLAWSSGYEDYDVQQVDVLMRQVKCMFEQAN